MMNDKQMIRFLLGRIENNNETTKIEFKKSINIHHRKGQAELIKDILAMANAVSEGEGTGYLVIGAHNGKTYDISRLRLDDATLQQIVNRRCHKPVRFEYRQYILEKGNTIGVIVVPRSDDQPHIVKEDFFDERGHILLFEGECPIREGTSIRRASREDFDRMYQERSEKERQKTIQHVLGLVQKETKKTPSLPDIKTMDLRSLESTMLDMIRQGDYAGLKASVNEMRLTMIQKWNETKDKKIFDEEKVETLKNLVLRPTLDRLTLIGKMDMQYSDGKIFRETLKALSSIYELSNSRDLGIVGTGEHLSWTVPSKFSLESLYILGAYLTLERKVDAIKALLSLCVQNRRKRLAPMVYHPNYHHPSGEGDLTEFFDGAVEHVKGMPPFFEWFDSSNEIVSDMFCQFDFLVACSKYMNGKPLGFPNFARYFKERQSSLWNHVESEPKLFKMLLGDDPVETVSQVIKAADMIAHRYFKWFHSWV